MWNAPQAAAVGVIVTDAFELFFDTLDSTRKVGNLRTNPRVAFVIGGLADGEERTVQYEGVVDEPTGRELDDLKARYFARFPDGPERQAWPGLTYMRARPRWIRFSDFHQTPPEIVELTFNETASQAGMTPVGLTACWIAASRALETESATPLFTDPYGRELAGDAGFAMMSITRAAMGMPNTSGPEAYLSIRTRFLDDGLAGGGPRLVDHAGRHLRGRHGYACVSARLAGGHDGLRNRSRRRVRSQGGGAGALACPAGVRPASRPGGPRAAVATAAPGCRVRSDAPHRHARGGAADVPVRARGDRPVHGVEDPGLRRQLDRDGPDQPGGADVGVHRGLSEEIERARMSLDVRHQRSGGVPGASTAGAGSG